MSTKILVTDCWTRKTLSAVRSLGLEGCTVHAVTHTRASPAIHSRFVSDYFVLPYPKQEPKQYLKKLLMLLQTERYDLLIPMEDETIAIVLEHRAEVERYTRVVLPARGAYDTAADKEKTLALAHGLGVPIPKCATVATIDAALAFANEAGYPVVLKPRSASGSHGMSISRTSAELRRNFNVARKRYSNLLIQEKLEGEGVGVGVLCQTGHVHVAFSYKRLREYPVKGGPSTVRESTDDAQTKAYATKLMSALHWDGVAMVEFKRDKHGEPKLMEINPRFWGSLNLAQVSGINFPYLLYKLSQGESITQPQYRVGVRCRWLMGDILHFFTNPRRSKLEPPFFQFKGMYYDEFMRGDTVGNIASVICPFFSLFDPEIWRLGIFRK